MMRLPPPPPLRGFFGTPDERRAAFRYWVRDTLVGLLELGLYYLFRVLPIDWCSDFGAFISRFTRYKYPASEARARKLWAHFNPDKADPVSVDAAIDRLWRGVSRTMTEFPLLDRFWKAGRVSVENVEFMQQARAAGRPIILAFMHLGNWEVSAIAVVETGFPGAGLYEPPENRFEHRLAVKSRLAHGARLIQSGPTSIREALKELKSPHGVFGIFIDEVIADRVQAPAFGRPLNLGGNLAYAVRLAAMTGAALIPVHTIRQGDAARFKVTFMPPLELARSSDRAADLAENVRRLDTVIAPVIAHHLDQWYYALDFEFDAEAPPPSAPH